MKKLLLILFVICLAGCSQTVTNSQEKHLGTTHVFDKNYEIGQKQFAYVGQQIIKVKDYYFAEYSSDYMEATSNFKMINSGPVIADIIVQKGQKYLVVGEVDIDNEKFMVAAINPNATSYEQNYRFLIKENGEVHNKVMNTNIVMVYNFSFEPLSPPFFQPTTVEKIDTKQGFTNYELIFGGTDGKSISIDYREYTSDNLARPAYSQNLVYEVGSDKIRYNNTVIQIHEVTSEKIVYTVVSDK
tara:strand:- start:360 stop:1088 length:729 start_codon:yes stop_codon:yes gene_type:complete